MTRQIILLLLGISLANAELYKWADENGTIHFSQTPPENGGELKKIQPKSYADPNAKNVDLEWISEKLLREAPAPSQEITTKNQNNPATTSKPITRYTTSGTVVARDTVIEISGRIEGGAPCKNLSVSAYASNSEGGMAHIRANAGNIGHGIKSAIWSGKDTVYKKSNTWRFDKAYVTCDD